MPVNRPEYDVAVETSWDGVDQEEFESFEQFASVHVWHNVEDPESSEDVELPVAHMEDGQLKLVYEALNSAHDLAEQAVGEENAEQVRDVLENLREEEFPDREPLDADQSRATLNYIEKSISDDEVPECISDKIDEGMSQEQAVAACLDMAEEGSSEPSETDTMTDENVMSMQERLQEAKENPEKVERSFISSKDIDVVKDSDGKVTLNVPIQALSEDRDNDFVNEKGQEAIIRQLNSGEIGMFPNHGVGEGDAIYDFRDIFGKFVDGDNRNGTTIGTAVMREVENEDGEKELHPHASQLVNLLEQDMPVGFSVGFIPKDSKPREDSDEGQEISDLDLMEVSAVGIPSNPDAMPAAMSNNAVAMAKSVMEKGKTPQEAAEMFQKAVDTMSDKTDESENTDQKEESKSDLKQISQEEFDEVMGVVGGAAQGAEEDLIDGLEAELDLSDEEVETAGGIAESVMQDMVDNVEDDLSEMVTDSKSNEGKDITSEDVERVMEVVQSSLNKHMGVALDEAEDEVMNMVDDMEEETTDEDEDMEENGTHDDEEDDEEEMSADVDKMLEFLDQKEGVEPSDPVFEDEEKRQELVEEYKEWLEDGASDHTEDDEKDASAESENSEQETQSTAEKNQVDNSTIKEQEQSDEEEKSEEEIEEEKRSAFHFTEDDNKSEGWGTTLI